MWTIPRSKVWSISFHLEMIFSMWVPSAVGSSCWQAYAKPCVKPHLLLLAAIISTFVAEYLGRIWCCLSPALNHEFLLNKYRSQSTHLRILSLLIFLRKVILKLYPQISLQNRDETCHCIKQSAIGSANVRGTCNQVIATNTLTCWAIQSISSWKNQN